MEQGRPQYLLANVLIVLGGWTTTLYLGDGSDVAMIESFLRPERPRIVRRAAAVALGTVLRASASTDVLGVLVEGTEDDEHLQVDTDGLG